MPTLQYRVPHMRQAGLVQKQGAITIWKLATTVCDKCIDNQFVGKSTMGAEASEATITNFEGIVSTM